MCPTALSGLKSSLYASHLSTSALRINTLIFFKTLTLSLSLSLSLNTHTPTHSYYVGLVDNGQAPPEEAFTSPLSSILLVADISGFTKLSKHLLSTKGKDGPDLTSQYLNKYFHIMVCTRASRHVLCILKLTYKNGTLKPWRAIWYYVLLAELCGILSFFISLRRVLN